MRKILGNKLMGKILCLCGYIHSDTCGSDGHLFKYDEWGVNDQDSNDTLYPLSVFECPECGNLMIDDPENASMLISYKPINGKYNKILGNDE
jgi:hypothetical protein